MGDKRQVGDYGDPRGDEDGGPQREDPEEDMMLTYSNVNGPEGQEVILYFGNGNNIEEFDVNDIMDLDENDVLEKKDEVGDEDLTVGAEANQLNREQPFPFDSSIGDDVQGMNRRCEHLRQLHEAEQSISRELARQIINLESDNVGLGREKERLTKENEGLKGDVQKWRRRCREMVKRGDYYRGELKKTGEQFKEWWGSEAAGVGGQQNGGVGMAVRTAAGASGGNESGGSRSLGPTSLQPGLQNQDPSRVARPALPSQQPTPSTSRLSMGTSVAQAPRPCPLSSLAVAAASRPQQQPIESTPKVVMGPPATPAPKARPFGQPRVARPSMYGPPLATRGPALYRPRFAATAPRFATTAPSRTGPSTEGPSRERSMSPVQSQVGPLSPQRQAVNQEATSPPLATGSCKRPRTRKILQKNLNIQNSGKPRGRPRKIPKLSDCATRTTCTTQAPDDSQGPQKPTKPKVTFHPVARCSNGSSELTSPGPRGHTCRRCVGVVSVFSCTKELYEHVAYHHDGRNRKLTSSGTFKQRRRVRRVRRPIPIDEVELSEAVIANPSPQANPEPLPEHYLVISDFDKDTGESYYECTCGKVYDKKNSAKAHVTAKNRGFEG